jgi:hypothetical protein
MEIKIRLGFARSGLVMKLIVGMPVSSVALTRPYWAFNKNPRPSPGLPQDNCRDEENCPEGMLMMSIQQDCHQEAEPGPQAHPTPHNRKWRTTLKMRIGGTDRHILRPTKTAGRSMS